MQTCINSNLKNYSKHYFRIHGYQLIFDAVDHLIKANMSIDKTGGKGTRKGSPCANYSRLRAEEGEVGSEGRLLSFLCLSCDVIHNGICSNGVLQSCYKPATNAALFEICCKLIWSKCCYKPATNANLLFYVL